MFYNSLYDAKYKQIRFILHHHHHFVVTTESSKSLMVESFFKIWAFPVWILPFWSLICSSISPNLSYIGNKAYSVIFCSFCILALEELYCFLQNANSLFIDSISSFINYIDFPKGAVFWQMLWIMLFTKSSSFSVNYPVVLIRPFSLSSAFFFFLPPKRPMFSSFLFFSVSACVYFSASSCSYPSFLSSSTFLLYCCFYFGLSMTGSIGASSSFGSSTFSTGFFPSFFVFAADGGLSIFFFYCFT